ncbi:hypothetical protein BCV70DRAFT_156838 [Testicularia cyperi]|uniref:Sister chromatid cohesion protein n=1 Tax=Testicularia cyperi TaxID=1882483 RepID=A0A317XUN0_9BASI|nr:hypothetical protein BCV70DRAFT_156838 [Testicularia cyperi]
MPASSASSSSSAHPVPRPANPASPSLMVARNHASLINPARSGPFPSEPAEFGSIRATYAHTPSRLDSSSTLDHAMSTSSTTVSAPGQPIEVGSSYDQDQLKPKKSRQRKPKRPKATIESNAVDSTIAMSDAGTGQSTLSATATLPSSASNSDRLSQSVLTPQHAPQWQHTSHPFSRQATKDEDTGLKTPPLPSAAIMSIQESPDPLNLFSPHNQISAWQPPHQQQSPHISLAAIPLNNGSSDSLKHTPNPIASMTQPIKTKSKPSKRKEGQSDDVIHKKRKRKVKAAEADPFNDKDVAQISVVIPAPTDEMYQCGTSSPFRPPAVQVKQIVSKQEPEHRDDAKPKKKRKRKDKKSFAVLMNQIVQDSDSGQDAEGSDWDELDVLEKSVTPGNSFDSPRNLGKISVGPVKTSHRKVPLAKLHGFMEDLFEADDTLPDRESLQEILPGQSLSPAADHFFEILRFHTLSGDRTVLVLRASMLQKLLKLVMKCSRTLAEVSSNITVSQTPSASELSSIPPAELTRLLTIVERTAKVGEDVDPFPAQATRAAMSEPTHLSSKKRSKKKGAGIERSSRSPSKTPEQDDDAQSVDDGREGKGPPESRPDGQSGETGGVDGEESLETLNMSLVIADRSLLAAECCLSVLTGDVLPKQILSEDLIRACFEATKVCLDRIVLPFIEGCSGAAAVAPHPVLTQLIDVLAPQKPGRKKAAQSTMEDAVSSIATICRGTLADLFRHLCSALFFVQRMVRMPSIALSDSIVISAVYLALGPFFVLEPEQSAGGGGGSTSNENAKAAARGRSALLSLGGANSMKTLRLPALHLLRNIFARVPDQRQWMIEEILTSLTKLTDIKKNRRQYTLRNGKGIHSINALLLQLIQAASHGISNKVRAAADRIAQGQNSDDATAAASKDESGSARQAEEETGPRLEVVIDAFQASEAGGVLDAREAEIVLWRRGLEGANQSARSIAAYLIQRVGQTKVAKTSQEMSHSFLIENMVQDLLNALYLPEWPAAALMLSAFCRVFGSYLDDPKSHPDAKGVALEQLGLVATRLRQSQLTLGTLRDPAIPNDSAVKVKSEASTSDVQSTVDLTGLIPSSGPSGMPLRMVLSPSKRPKWTGWDYLSLLRALRELDRAAVREFVQAYAFIVRFLSKTASEDQSTEGAIEFLVVQAQGELAFAHAKAGEELERLQSMDEGTVESVAKVQHFREELDEAMSALSQLNMQTATSNWTAFESDEKALSTAIDLSERALIASSSIVTYDTLRDLLIEGLNSQLIANRSKALRGIDRIAQVDPDVLDQDSIRLAVEVRLRDSSGAVRDSAVGLFGSYLLRKPEHLPRYYPQLSVRVLDTGLSVRKRMVRLLKTIHESTDNWKIRVDSCVRIVRCINDEDTIVQDMAVLTLGELWLGMEIGDLRRLRRRGSPGNDVATIETDVPEVVPKMTAADAGDTAMATVEEGTDFDLDGDAQTEKKVLDIINVIMAVAEVVKERPSPLEEVFRRIFKDKSEAEAADLHAKMQRLGDSMIDSLVESSEVSNMNTVKRIRIVQLLVSTNPAILTISKAKLLLPYLKAAQTSEEVQIMDLLLRIFRSCLPHMPRTALAFAEALESSLKPLVNRPPPKAGLHLLQELIACYCAVITIHTRNFRLLIQTLRACFVRVQSIRNMAIRGQRVEDNKAWNTLMSLTASLCEHADFDGMRKRHPETAADLDTLSKRPLVDVISEALLDIHKHGSEAVRSVSLQNLGFIFRAQPTLMTRPAMTSMMDKIFAQGSLQDRATLLKIILDFLSADSARRNPDQTVVTAGTGRRKPEDPNASSVDMTVLVGNTETFADTGVGSAMMQRYSEDVLKATLEVSNPALQRTAIDILRFTVLQGLSHPIQCVPYLVSLETLDDRKIRSRALELHSHLASKHASLVQARFIESARFAFQFQLGLKGKGTIRGYRADGTPSAMLDAWYGLLRDRRATRLDFLKQIVKALDVNTAATDCTMQEVLFARFIADNLATLDYKTMEELFIVIGELRSILAVSGMQVLYMSQTHLPQVDNAATANLDEGARTRTPPPTMGSTFANDLISPMGMARNPWLSGEWQLELASDTGSSMGPSTSQTIDPSRLFAATMGTQDTIMSSQVSGVLRPVPQAETSDSVQPGNSNISVGPVEAARMSVMAGTALLLRNHLKHLYGLSEARCAKFNPTKKQSAGADKPATMRSLADPMQAALDLSSMPAGLMSIDNEDEALAQMKAYTQMVENEGTMMEPEDAEMFDDLAL